MSLAAFSDNPFRDYWQKLQAVLPLFLIISFLAAAIVWGFITSRPQTYQAHFSYLVSLSQREPAPTYRFDGYYALQATDLFTATLARWIQTPETIVTAYSVAGFKLPTESPREISKLIRAEKTAPQLVQVTIEGKSNGEVRALTNAVREVMDANIDSYHDQGIPAVSFRVVATEPWIGINKLSAQVIAVATFFFTLFISINIWLLILTGQRQSTY